MTVLLWCYHLVRSILWLVLLVLVYNKCFFDVFGAEHVALLLFVVVTPLSYVFYILMSVFLQLFAVIVVFSLHFSKYEAWTSDSAEDVMFLADFAQHVVWK